MVLLGHGENSIFHVHNELRRSFPGLAVYSVIADVRDAARIDRIFARYRPQHIFHAAAHKHVPLMERNPVESVTNNVGGTRNLLRVAEAHGCRNFVMISTDKAVHPTSVMGATKRVAEHLVVAAAHRTGACYVAVRFGNVLGSRGSVVPLFEGATPVFVDIESETYNLDPDDLAQKIALQTRAIMAVDIFGHPVEWDAVIDIAAQHDLKIIDDSCEALGAEYKGRKIGQFGDAAAFSFYPNKQITTGEGGILVTDDDEIVRLCRSMRNQGRDEMSAAPKVSQFRRLETFLQKCETVAQMYTERLQDLEGVRPPVVKPHVRMSWFVYVITLAEGLNRDPIMEFMAEQGIPTRGYFAPIHTQPYIRERFGDLYGTLPVTESVAQRAIALPFHNNLTEQEVEIVVAALACGGLSCGV